MIKNQKSEVLYSGQQDRNGKNIYQGDSLRCDHGSVIEVEVQDGCFGAKGDYDNFLPLSTWDLSKYDNIGRISALN